MVKDGAPVAYATINNERSMNFCKAFAKGCGGTMATHANMLLPGAAAGFWLPDLMPILKAAQDAGRTWYYGDKAYFNRAHYFRITKNAKMITKFLSYKPDRFKQLNLHIKPWGNGSEVLICPQSDTYFRLNGTTQSDWIKSVTKKIRQNSDRPTRVHLKSASGDTERLFRRQLVNAWAVVVHSSMAGVQAVVNGVPCFATDTESTAYHFGTSDFSLMENPVKPDNREQMAWALADNQWTLAEIESGMAWEHLNGMG